MATQRWSPKDPQDVRDYWIDFAPLGLAADETLTTETVTLPDQDTPEDPFELLAVEADSVANDTWVVVRFSGGTPGNYLIQYHVTTSTGQELDLTKTLVVKERTA